jgi:spermidine/putrescine-binding protein
MLRISMIGTSILLIVALLLSACTVSPAGPTGDSGAASPAAPSSGGMKTEIGPGEGQVDIIAWAGYIERGETDPAYDWVTMFEEATGCKVNVKVAGTSDEMVTLMNQGALTWSLPQAMPVCA